MKIEGNVTSFSRPDSTAFINVKETTGYILVVDFDSEIELSEGQKVEVTGHVSQYRGTLEVIAKEIDQK